MLRNTIGKLFGALVCFGLASCGQTGIREAVITPEKNLPRPARILVYDFAVSEREVTEYQGIMRQQPTIKDPAERERQIAIDVKNAGGLYVDKPVVEDGNLITSRKPDDVPMFNEAIIKALAKS